MLKRRKQRPQRQNSPLKKNNFIIFKKHRAYPFSGDARYFFAPRFIARAAGRRFYEKKQASKADENAHGGPSSRKRHLHSFFPCGYASFRYAGVNNEETAPLQRFSFSSCFCFGRGACRIDRTKVPWDWSSLPLMPCTCAFVCAFAGTFSQRRQDCVFRTALGAYLSRRRLSCLLRCERKT